jgi:hypothetical protein
MDLTQAQDLGSGIGLTVIITLAAYKKLKDSGYLDIFKEVLHQENDSVLTKLSLSDDDMQVLEEYAKDEQGKIDTKKLKSILETYEKINRILEKNKNCQGNPDKALTVIHKMINDSKK